MDEQQLQQRVDQWEKMAHDDPDNSMGWFSLGNAYKDVDRDGEAARSFRKAIELDEGFSRAYQLLAQLLIAQNMDEQAREVLTKGYVIAGERGDIMPQKAMGSLLEKIGAPVPQVEKKEQVVEPISGEQVQDSRTGKPGPRLADPPMRGPVGQYIFAHYSQPTWNEWINMGTKVINELRLDFSNVDHQKVYETHMMEWLGFTEADVQQFEQSSEDE